MTNVFGRGRAAARSSSGRGTTVGARLRFQDASDENNAIATPTTSTAMTFRSTVSTLARPRHIVTGKIVDSPPVRSCDGRRSGDSRGELGRGESPSQPARRCRRGSTTVLSCGGRRRRSARRRRVAACMGSTTLRGMSPNG